MGHKGCAMTTIIAVVAVMLIIPAGGTVFAQTTGSIEVVRNPMFPTADDFSVTVPDGGLDPFIIDFKPHIRDNETAVGDLTVVLESSNPMPLLGIVGGTTGANDGSEFYGALTSAQSLTLQGGNSTAYAGGTYTYTYNVTDADNHSDTGLLEITVESADTFILLYDQRYVILQDTKLDVSLADLRNNHMFSYPNATLKDGAVINSVGTPMNGTATKTSTGDLEYMPNSGFYGTDSFEITVEASDNNSGSTHSDTATVTVEVVKKMCEIDLLRGSLDFGQLYNTQVGPERTIFVNNTGNVLAGIYIFGEHWTSGGDIVMNAGNTTYSATSGDYSSKTPVPGPGYQIERVTQIDNGTATDIYVQAQVNLENPSFTGAIQQEITVTTICN